MSRTFSAVLADDVADLRFLVRLALEGSGRFEVVGEVDNGEDAVRVAEELKPDVVLLDISMPRKDGLEALPEILEASPGTSVVILSGFEAERLGATARARGAAAYLEKGVPPDQMVASVLDALEPGVVQPTPNGAAPGPKLSPSISAEELLSFVGHEIRTPLAVIHGFGATLQERWATLPEDQRLDLVRRMTANSIYLDSVLTNVLQSRSPLEAGGARTTIQETLPLFKSLADDLTPLSGGRRIVVDIDDELPPVIVDTHRLRQVMTNLVVNAAKYSPTGTDVTIKARREGADVLVSVVDRGPGIPADQREAVFERFVQIDVHSKGLGLGLYICRTLVRAMGGDIWISDDAPGTTVCFRLPAAADD